MVIEIRRRQTREKQKSFLPGEISVNYKLTTTGLLKDVRKMQNRERPKYIYSGLIKGKSWRHSLYHDDLSIRVLINFFRDEHEERIYKILRNFVQIANNILVHDFHFFKTRLWRFMRFHNQI